MSKRLTVSEYWDLIFEKYNILNKIEKEGFFIISAEQIREYKEPRLMTKFDFSKQLPQIFKKYNLGMLPINNGTYILGDFNLYSKLPSIKPKPKILEIPSYIETIDPNNVYSESNALHVALLSGILDDAIGEKLVQTISGRMRPNGFSFKVSTSKNNKTRKITIDRPQIEIDGGYESLNKVILVEAKNQQPDDFIIRQLFYPYRYWNEKVKKEVIPVFFTYDNGIYTVYVYKFIDPYNYNSLELIYQKSYIVQYGNSDYKKKEILKNIHTIEEKSQKSVPFPQADSFNLVIQTLFLINDGINTSSEVAENLGYDKRQGNYYIAACRYLELIQKENKEYILTNLGKKIIDSNELKMNEILFKQILKHKVFNLVFKEYIESGKLLNNDEIAKLISLHIPELSSTKNGSYNSTPKRRASTVRSWVNWLIGTII